MGVPIINTGPMTIEEFYAFTDRQPDEEKWELIASSSSRTPSDVVVFARSSGFAEQRL